MLTCCNLLICVKIYASTCISLNATKIWYLQCKSIIRFQEIDQSFKHQGTFPLTNTYRMKYYGTWRRSTRIVMCILIFLLNVHEMDQANFAVWCKGSLTLLKFWMKFLIFYFKNTESSTSDVPDFVGTFKWKRNKSII